MAVPLLDLKRQYRTLEKEIWSSIEGIVEEQAFILGRPVAEFEEAVAEYLGVGHAVGCASGTDALLLPLMALDLRAGDEVVTTPFTFFATAGAIHNAGGRPVFVDIDAGTFNIRADAVEVAVTERTKAILPVHLFGQMADMPPLRRIADAHGLFLLEDAAQAIGAKQNTDDGWVSTAHYGDAAAYSFFPSKNLGGFGDGGLMATNHDALAERLRRMRVHGGLKMYHHEEVGTNSRLDALQAAVLLAKLPALDGWSEGRRRHAAWYDQLFEPLEREGFVKRPVVSDDRLSVFNQYTIRAQDRDALKEHLASRGIGCAVYYPVPLHLQPCFECLGYREGEFPESERAAREVLSLPIFGELTESELHEVADAVESFYR